MGVERLFEQLFSYIVVVS